MPEKPDLEMTAGMAYDPSGAAEAKADVADTAATAETAAASTEQAAQKSAAASDKDAEKQKLLAEMMKLTTMARRELQAEIQRLIALQKAAAQANNAKEYEKLTASINRAKVAMEKLNTATAVSTIAIQNQAQTGMQFAQGLGSLAASAKKGTAGLAEMAVQAIALGTAIKAGLGPIGWVMAALQGLGMVVTYFADSEKEEKEAIEATTKALNEHKKALDDIAAAHEKNAASQAAVYGDQRAAAIKNEGRAELAALNENNTEKRLVREKELADLRADHEKKRRADAKAVQDGSMDPTVAAAREQSRQKEYAEREKEAEKQANLEQQARLTQEQSAGKKILAARTAVYNELTKGMDDREQALLSVDDKAMQEILARLDQVKGQIDSSGQRLRQIKDTLKGDDLKRAREAHAEEEAKLEAERADLEARLLGITADQVAVLERHQRLDAETEEGKAREAVAIVAGVHAAKDAVNEQLEANKALGLQAQELTAQGEIIEKETQTLHAAAQAATEEENAARTAANLSKQWEAKQKETTPQRIKWLQETLHTLQENSQIWQQYNKALQREEASARQEEWQRVQRDKSLQDQAAWLSETAGHLKAGSEEAQKWEEQLQSVNQAMLAEQWAVVQKEKSLQDQSVWLKAQLGQIQKGSKLWETYNKALHNVTESMVTKELAEMGETYKVAGQYAVEDKRTQYKILHKDREMLEARAKRLRGMLAEEHDAGLREQITKALKENLDQQKGLTEATLANSRAARARLKAYQPPKYHHENKMVERNRNRLGEAYARTIKLEEKYAARGNYKAAARQDRIRRKIGEKITEFDKGFAKQLEKDTDDLKASSKKQVAESRKRLRRQQKQNKEDQKRDGEDSKKKKKPQERGQKKPRQEKPKQAPQQQKKEHELAGTKAALADAQKALGDMSGKVAELAGVTAQIASAATEIAKTAGAKLKSLKQQLKIMQTDISNLWKEIDA